MPSNMQRTISMSAMTLAVTSLIFLVIGVSTRYWAEYEQFHSGLYSQCLDKTCEQIYAVQGKLLMEIVFFFAVAAVVNNKNIKYYILSIILVYMS